MSDVEVIVAYWGGRHRVECPRHPNRLVGSARTRRGAEQIKEQHEVECRSEEELG